MVHARTKFEHSAHLSRLKQMGFFMVLDMCTAERFLLFRVSLFLSVILIFSVFLSLYLSPFPTVNSNTNNMSIV